MSSLERFTVLGAGVLGGQIAWHSAFKGKTVALYDIAQDAIDRCRVVHEHYAAIYRSDVGASDADITGTRQRLTDGSDVATPVAELLPPDTVVATNSSTLLDSAAFRPRSAHARPVPARLHRRKDLS